MPIWRARYQRSEFVKTARAPVPVREICWEGGYQVTKTLVVTGCSRGIGRHIALRMAALGWSVWGTLRSESGREELESAGVRVLNVDVTNETQVVEAVAAVVREDGKIDAFVANAGIGTFGCFETLIDTQIRQMMEVNFFGVLSCARAVLPSLRQSRGRLVVISSVAGRRGAPGASGYNASKFAVGGWAEGLSYELEPFGVSVSLVEPGPVETGFFDARWGGEVPEGSPYEKITEQLAKKLDGVRNKWVDVADVGCQVERLLTVSNPSFRVVVGYKNKAQVILNKKLPESWWRAMVRRAVSLG